MRPETQLGALQDVQRVHGKVHRQAKLVLARDGEHNGMAVQSAYQFPFETRVWRHETNKETNPENIRQCEKAMKKLQNDYTTQEQSKRLLELGLSADSADCYLIRTRTEGDTFIVQHLHDELYSRKDKFEKILEYLPCWSVGRLIEIFELCTGKAFLRNIYKPIVTDLIGRILYYKCHNKLDFSKLED